MKSIRHLLILPALLILIIAVGCSASPSGTNDPAPLESSETDPPGLAETAAGIPTNLGSDPEQFFLGLTYQAADGNRLVLGAGKILEGDPLVIQLQGEAAWLVGVPYQNGVLWTAALTDGNLENFLVKNGSVEAFAISPGSLPADMPPQVLVHAGQPAVVDPPSPEASILTHPIFLDPETGRQVFITDGGELILWENGQVISSLPARALPDSRLLHDDSGRVLFLSDPTDRYDHGVLGDRLEAGSITLVETDPALTVVTRIEIPAPAVVEGIAPIWSDLNGDGQREILVTVSDQVEGARLVLFSEQGQVLAQSPSAGQGYRWRHQLAAAPLGSGNGMMILDVLRPHLDARLEFFSWQGEELVLEAELPGFSSHGIGSRNLDMALVGDLDGDGNLEVVVPDLSRESLNGVGYLDGRAVLLWSVPLGGKLTSNLAGLELLDGSLVLGASVGDQLLVWQ